MGKFVKHCVVGFALILSSYKLFGQATVLVDAVYPNYETVDQRTIIVRFDQVIVGTATVTDWNVRIAGTDILEQTATKINTTDVRVTFSPSDLNGLSQNFILPGQAVTVEFTNSSGSLTTFAGGAPASSTGGFVAAVNNYVPTCGDTDLLGKNFYNTVDVCAPVGMNFWQWIYEVSLVYRNSSEYGKLKFNMQWGDPLATNTNHIPFDSDNNGGVTPTYSASGTKLSTQPVSYSTVRPTFSYPSTYTIPAPTSCEFTARLTPFFDLIVSCAGQVDQTLIASWDNDNLNTGTLNLPPLVANSDLVCLGTNVTMQFNDATDLNCRSAVEINVPNQSIRWIRIVYGSQDLGAGNIPDIRVGGVPVTDASGALLFPGGYFPTGAGGVGVPDNNGVIKLSSTSNVTSPTGINFSELIATIDPSNQVVGQQFIVRLEYWNTCNRYDDISTANAQFVENDIIIIDKPNPPPVNNPILCETAVDADFEITASGVGGAPLTYTWYKDAALTNVLQATSTDNTFNPVTEGLVVMDRIVKAVTGSQTFTRYVTVTQGSNGCTSPPQTITIQIDDTNTPGTIAHPLGASPITVCSGTDPTDFTSTFGATGGGPGGAFTYQWQASTLSATTGFADIPLENSDTYNPPMLTQPTHFRRVAISPTCAPVPSNAITFIVNPLPTGVVSGGGKACNFGAVAAPNIIFTFTGTAPFNFGYAINLGPPVSIFSPTSTYVLAPVLIGDYTLVSLTDNNLCDAVSLGLTGNALVATSPDAPPTAISFTPSSSLPVCDDGGSTIAPDGILELAGGADDYEITYSINNNFYTQSITSDLLGLITLSTDYLTDWDGSPGSHDLDIITIKNVNTECAGSTPFGGVNLTVNSRPATPTGPINSIACSNPDVGAPLNVDDPDPLPSLLGVDITWSTGGTTLASYNNAVSSGAITGFNNKTFTPATSATSTFFAFAINSVSGCISNNGIAVSQQQDLAPAGVTAGPDQLTLCADNPTATMAASAPGLGQTGTWTVPGEIVYFQNFSGVALNTQTFNAINGWVQDVSQPNSFPLQGGGGYFEVRDIGSGNRAFESDNLNGNNLGSGAGLVTEVVWTTPQIDISSISPIDMFIDLIDVRTNNDIEGGLIGSDRDYISVFYKLNGLPTEIPFTTNGFLTDDWNTGLLPTGNGGILNAGTTGISGNLVQIVIRVRSNGANERIAFDNVTIKKSSSTIVITNPNSNTTTVTNLPAPAPGNSPITTPFKWSVTSPLGVCAPTESVVNLQVNPLPTSNIITPVLCDASPGIPLEVPLVDLTATYSPLVTDGATVLWYSDVGRTAQITSPLTVSHGNTFYWRATSAVGCQNIGDVTFTVRALPSAIDQTIEICEDAVGSGSATGIVLTSYEATITNGETPRTLEWYEDDGSGGLGASVGSLTNYSIASAVAVTRLLHLKVIDSSSPTVPPCFEIADVKLEYKIRPTNNLIQDGLGNVVGPTFTICTSNSLVLLQVDPNQNPGSDYVWNIPPTFGEFEIVANDNTFFVILRFPTAIPGNPPSTNYPSGLPITVTEMYGSCTGNTIGTTVIVESNPVAPVVSGPPRVCVDGPATFAATPAITTATYTWTFPSGVTILSADPTQSSMDVKWGSTGGDVFVSYETPTGCVSASSVAFPVIVIDRPNILSANAISICNGQNVGTQYLLQSDILNTTYNWIVTGVTGSVSGAAINNQATNVTAINQTLTNTSSAPATVTYEITPIGPLPDFCEGPVHVLTVSLNVPVVNSGLDTEICSREVSGIVLSTDGISVGAGSYKLLAITVVPSTVFEASVTITSSSPVVAAGKLVPGSSNAIVGASGGIDFIRNDKFINTTSLPIIIKYEIIGISPAPASCPGPSEIIELTINPEPILDPLLSPTTPICSDDTIEGANPGFELKVQAGSVTAATFTINRIEFPGLIAGVGNEGIGTGKLKDDIDGDSYTNTTAGQLTATYYIIPVSPAGCLGAEQTVIIIVNASPAVKSNLDRIVCNGVASGIVLQDRSLEVVPSAPAAFYDIVSVRVGGISISPGATVSGLTAAGTNALLGITADINVIRNDSYVNTTTERIIVTYEVVPQASVLNNSCRGPGTFITLTVEPQVTSNSLLGDTDICSGDAISLTFVSPTYANGAVTNPVVTFSYTMVAVTGISGNTLGNNLSEGTIITDALVNTTDNPIKVNYKITPRASAASNGVGCTGTVEDVFVTVQPRPKITTINNKTVCESDPINLSLVSTTVPSSGSIKFFVTAVPSSGNVIGFTTNSFALNNTVLADALVNNGSVTESVTYTIEPRNVTAGDVTICAGPSITVMVTVSPRPIITPIADFAICSGEPFNPIPIVTDTETAIPGSTLVTWTVTPDATVTGESNGAGNSFSQVLFNNSSDKRTVVYTINAKNITNSPSCSGTPITLNVTVYPVPKIVSLPSSVNVCNNGALTPNPYILTSSVVASLNPVFDWTIDDDSNPDLADLPSVTNGTSINQTFVNTGPFLGTYQYTITPHLTIPASANPLVGNTCTGQEGIMIVNVAPPVEGEIYGFDINGDKATNLFLCKGAKEFVYIDPIGLPLMEVVYKEGSVTKTLTKLGGLNILQVSPTVTTVYELISVKDKFGCVKNINQSVTVNVDAVSNEFSIVGPTISCSPFQVQFKHNQIAGVNYTWKWLDGPDSTTYQATSTVIGKIIKHTFLNPSPSTQAKFKVSLEAFLDTTKYQLGCKKLPFVKEVKVYPTISTGVFPDNTVLCSGETVKFVNTSQGVSASGHRWFYRVFGSTQELEAKTTSSVSYKLVNESSSNPIIYEVVYKATNGNCPADEVVTPITVYRGATAKFDEGVVPPHIGGHSIVTFANLTAPIDASDFRYEWEFGADAVPPSANGVGPFTIDYLTPGDKDVILTVTNTGAEADGRTCVYEFRKTINILLLPLVANFKATPQAACFPSDIVVTENTATGDVMEWRVVDSNGRVAATSNANLPVFQITNPGKYSIFLKTSSSFTGQEANTQQDNFEIYPVPVASFDARPSLLFVPDTELVTYNFTTGATDYLWDFGDNGTSTEEEPKYLYKIEGVYDLTLIALNDHGDGVVCSDTLSRKITAKQGGVTKVPNAFTPNPNGPNGGVSGNGSFNDVFLPYVKGAEEFNMQIYDRWGNLIFESNNSTIGWDGYDRNGRLLQSGVYVYKLTLRLSDGQRTTQIGDITMIR